tara:strand:- start:1772 stop:2311 length:540 start_codon:yes stop_codon:yes gene_type:complete
MDINQKELHALQTLYKKAVAVCKETEAYKEIFKRMSFATRSWQDVEKFGVKVSITMPDGRVMSPSEVCAETRESSLRWEDAFRREEFFHTILLDHPADRTVVNDTTMYYYGRATSMDNTTLFSVVYYDRDTKEKRRVALSEAQVIAWHAEKNLPVPEWCAPPKSKLEAEMVCKSKDMHL